MSEAKIDQFETQELTNTVNIAEVKAANLLVETKIEAVEKELERPRPDVATARVELDALRTDFAELTKRIDEIEHKTEPSRK
jgi:predicted  nucleic acid-binding Zn-ribbon protein